MNSKEATHLSDLVANDGNGNPAVLDPLPGIPSHPFFRRDLKFCSTIDRAGRIRFAAFTIER
jgi:hypothetical protein